MQIAFIKQDMDHSKHPDRCLERLAFQRHALPRLLIDAPVHKFLVDIVQHARTRLSPANIAVSDGDSVQTRPSRTSSLHVSAVAVSTASSG